MTMGEVIRDYEEYGIERIVSDGEILSTEESLVLNYGSNEGLFLLNLLQYLVVELKKDLGFIK